jgi:hypothetical protein
LQQAVLPITNGICILCLDQFVRSTISGQTIYGFFAL